MADITIAQISLDIYNNNYIMVNAKQADTESRFIEITVTEKGKPFNFDKEMTTVHVRCSKPDGTYVYGQNANITDDGKIMMELEQQMLTSYGQCYVDLTLLQYITIDESTETMPKYKMSVLSTMGFYINVVEQPIDPSVVISTSDFGILTDNIVKTIELQEEMEKSLEKVKNITETEVQNVINNIGIVLNEEKGTANGIATLDSNAKVPASQINTQFTVGNKTVISSGEELNDILGKIAAYMNAFDNMPVVHTGTSDPDSSLGNDGDYYLKLLVG